LDYFPTPPWGTRAGAEVLLEVDPEARTVYDPACGGGHMADVLTERFAHVWRSDVHAYRPETPICDWLTEPYDGPEVDWVFTNPPFKIAPDFVRLGLQRARRGVALLLRMAFVEGVGRHPLFEGPAPLTTFSPFSERLPMTLGRWDPEASSATAYAWFFWMRDAPPQPPRWIRPGTRDRLWLPTDAERWGARIEGTLL